jgi:hypothetical protein
LDRCDAFGAVIVDGFHHAMRVAGASEARLREDDDDPDAR